MITIETLNIGAPILVAAVVGLYALATNYFDDKATAKRRSLKSAESYWAEAAKAAREATDRTLPEEDLVEKRGSLKSPESYWAEAAKAAREETDRTLTEEDEYIEAGFRLHDELVSHFPMRAANEDTKARALEFRDLAVSLDTSQKILEGLRRSRRKT
jgi:hypothetical protein